MSLNDPPTLSRVRHWSCPDKLPSTPSLDTPLSRPFYREMEDTLARPLASWEEKVLRWREERVSRRLKKIALVSMMNTDSGTNLDLTNCPWFDLKTDLLSDDEGRLDKCIEEKDGLYRRRAEEKDGFNRRRASFPSTGSCRVKDQGLSFSTQQPWDEYNPDLSSYPGEIQTTGRELARLNVRLGISSILGEATQPDNLKRVQNTTNSPVHQPVHRSLQYIQPCRECSQNPLGCSQNTPSCSKHITSYPGTKPCHYKQISIYEQLDPSPPNQTKPFTVEFGSYINYLINPEKPSVNPSTCASTEYKRTRSISWFSPWTSILLFSLVLINSCSLVAADQGPQVCVANININHKTNWADLAKYSNCTVLEGSLQINSALLDYQKAEDNLNFSFPHLVEITDYLLLYRANQIENLTSVLPKLAVIRGHRLINNYALAIYQMKNMRTLGLLSLTNIMKGGVRIEKNPSLCYVETIDWRQIVMDPIHKKSHIFIEENMDEQACSDTCKPGCENNCWDEDNCQIKLVKCPGGIDGSAGQDECYADNQGEPKVPCSAECIGGCSAKTSPEHCYACRNLWYQLQNNSTVCVEKCPEGLLSYKNWKCITEESCSKLENDGGYREEDKFYKIHTDLNRQEQQCVAECPANYQGTKDHNAKRWECTPCQNCPRHCDGGVINSREEAERFLHCTHITGELEIRVSEGDITPVLEHTMKDIKEISGTLKISRSFALVSLYFFKSLELIKGENTNEKFSITIMENENLQKLFPGNVKVEAGKAFIHYNQKLCMEEINNFIEKSGLKKPGVYEVSSVTNGNKAVCSKEKLWFNITGIHGRAFVFEFENYRQNLYLRAEEDVNALIGYEIYYREISEDQYVAKNISKFEGLDACGGNTWNVQDRRPSDNLGTCENSKDCNLPANQDDFPILVYKPETGWIFDLKPFTPYAVYATTLMVPHLATNATGAQSDIVYFRTDSEPPEEVRSLKWSAEETYSKLRISWSPPRRPHGIIDHYDIMLEYIPLKDIAKNRNYCSKKPEDKPEKAEIVVPKPKVNDTSNCPLCQCSKDDGKNYNKIEDFGDEHIDEQVFYSDLINKIFTIPITIGGGGKSKRSIRSGAESLQLLGQPEEEKYVRVNTKTASVQSHENVYNETSFINGSNVYGILYERVSGNQTEIVLKDLKHFALYQVKVMACQAERKYDVDCVDNCIMQKDCSPWSIDEAKTRPKPNADDIIVDDNKLDINFPNETTGDTYIRWRPPQDPNEMIVHYTLRRKSSMSDDTSNSYMEQCISLNQLIELDDGSGRVEYHLTTEGEYLISLRAVSLYSSGGWTSWQKVKVKTTASYYWIAIIVVIILLLIAGLMVGFVVRHKKKNPILEWEIVSRNPDYLDTGCVYQIDEWEVPRDLIIKGEELGSGSFGVCHKGIYNYPDKGPVSVAIKTVPERATFRQRIEFLNEASVMKEINTAHVVKLLGVVSQGQPTLVLMELMENGDLRKYLRSLRPDNNNRGGDPPTLQRTLQMALEIADGMAYLSVRKYVHRDLAARNCMVSSELVVKVGDFGMAQDVYEREYYRTEGRRLLPVRWMAPESLRDGKFTCKSDVWSYGVVLWEMATLAEQPYQGWSNDEVVRLVKEGNVMPKPENCPDIVYDLMKECWSRNPDHRPSFIDICERLLPEATEKFRSNAFYLSSQGAEAIANQQAQRQALEEAEHLTPLTNNGRMNGENGDPSQGESHAMRELRSPGHVSFSNNGGGSRSKSNGVLQRLRNKSGSTSGEA